MSWKSSAGKERASVGCVLLCSREVTKDELCFCRWARFNECCGEGGEYNSV